MGLAVAEVIEPAAPYAEAREAFEQTVKYLDSEEARALKHSDLERELDKRGCELMRRLYQGYLDSRAPGEVDGPVRDAEGVERTEKYDVKLTLVVDIIHVLEYVWKAGLALHNEGTAELERWVGERLLLILRGHASGVAAGMRRSATLRNLSTKQRAPIDTCADYLLTNRPYLDYADYLAAGLPIATGVIEGACRYLVKDRMDRTGARWSLQGAEAVLQLRALRSSHDFDEYWAFHEEQEYQRNHVALYVDGKVPATKEPARSTGKPHLTLIK